MVAVEATTVAVRVDGTEERNTTAVATDVGEAGIGEGVNTTVEEDMGVQAAGMAPASRMAWAGPSLASRQSLRLLALQ